MIWNRCSVYEERTDEAHLTQGQKGRTGQTDGRAGSLFSDQDFMAEHRGSKWSFMEIGFHARDAEVGAGEFTSCKKRADCGDEGKNLGCKKSSIIPSLLQQRDSNAYTVEGEAGKQGGQDVEFDDEGHIGSPHTGHPLVARMSRTA